VVPDGLRPACLIGALSGRDIAIQRPTERNQNPSQSMNSWCNIPRAAQRKALLLIRGIAFG
jgi:hypothetical protein